MTLLKMLYIKKKMSQNLRIDNSNWCVVAEIQE